MPVAVDVALAPVVRRCEGVVRQRLSGLEVEPEHLAPEARPVLRDRPLRRVAGADEQRSVRRDLGTAPRVATCRDRQAGEQVAHPLRGPLVLAEAPRHEPDVLRLAALLMGLARREQPRRREVRVHDHPHQPALALHEDVVEVGADPRGPGPLPQARHQGDPPGALGDEHLAVGEEPDVPAVLEAPGHHLDRQVRDPPCCGGPGSARLGAVPDAVPATVAGTSPTESSPLQAVRAAPRTSTDGGERGGIPRPHGPSLTRRGRP